MNVLRTHGGKIGIILGAVCAVCAGIYVYRRLSAHQRAIEELQRCVPKFNAATSMESKAFPMTASSASMYPPQSLQTPSPTPSMPYTTPPVYSGPTTETSVPNAGTESVVLQPTAVSMPTHMTARPMGSPSEFIMPEYFAPQYMTFTDPTYHPHVITIMQPQHSLSDEMLQNLFVESAMSVNPSKPTMYMAESQIESEEEDVPLSDTEMDAILREDALLTEDMGSPETIVICDAETLD